MATFISLATATTVLLIGSVSLLLSQDSPPITPKPNDTTLLGAIEIKPLPITADPTAMTKLAERPSNDDDPTWNRLTRHLYRDFEVGLWSFENPVFNQPCSAPRGADWKKTFDALAQDAGLVWRIRGKTFEMIPPELYKKLDTRLDGKSAKSGTRTQVINWFSQSTGLTMTLHASLGIDDGKIFTWSAQTATHEAWLDGLAFTIGATALLPYEGAVILYKPPAITPLDNDPEFIAQAPRLVYQAPPVARLDELVTLEFQDTEFSEVVKVLEKSLHYPVDLDPALLHNTSIPPVTLKVKDMKTRYVIDFVSKLSNLSYRILPDRVRWMKVDPEQQ